MEEWIYFNSHNTFYKKPFGAVPCGTAIRLQIKIQGEGIEGVVLRLWPGQGHEQDYSMTKVDDNLYAVELKATLEPGLMWYYFLIIKEGSTHYYGNNNRGWGGVGQISLFPPPAYQITVYKEDTQTPQWFKEGVVYQIFVDRFYNGCEAGTFLEPRPGSLLHGSWHDTPFYIREKDTGRILRWNFFGGNLPGIIKKLPYLQELGVTALYLNPIFAAPSNHKYDTADYKKIDPMFGTNDTFQELCQAAAKQGISVILDGVFSHTGSDSIYFNREGNYPEVGAYQSPQSPYYSWYRFHDYPDRYEAWWGIDTLPNVNELDPSYMQYMLYDRDSVIRYWTRAGARGWRLDVADELPDKFIQELRKVLKETDPQAVLIGEVWEDASNKISYSELRQYFWGDGLDSVMNYPFKNTMLAFLLGESSGREVLGAMMSLYENYPAPHFFANLNIIGSHDVPRILTLLGEGPDEQQLTEYEKEGYRLPEAKRSLAVARLKLLALLQMTFPGVPCIYYGDEVGMEGFTDPYNRGPFPWGREDLNLLAWYKKIIALRRQNPVFTRGSWWPLYGKDDIFAFIRTWQENGEVAVAIFNRDPHYDISLALDLNQWCTGELEDMLEPHSKISLNKGVLRITLQPLEGRILRGKIYEA